MSKPKPVLTVNRKQLVSLGIALLVIIVVVPSLSSFRDSLHALRTVRPGYALLALLATALTYAAAAATYCFLAFRPLSYTKTFVVQGAAMFINRLVPAGLGAFGANYAYLRAHKQTPAQAATMVSLNTLLGLGGHLTVLLITLALFHADLPALHTPHMSSNVLHAMEIVAALLILAVLLAKKLRMRLRAAARDVRQQLVRYQQHPQRLFAALGSSICLTLCNIIGLAACLAAVGGHLPFVGVLIVFTFGIGAGAATPTPGGLGGIEAGMAAGFIAYGVPHAPALAAVILYRLISYWLTLFIGAGAFVYCQRRSYFG